ncbi:MAG: hypothetical protein AAB507_01795 [Patescibacteria group bacterium]
MEQRTFNLAAGVVFSAVAVLHLLRVVLSWDAAIGGWDVPIWLSYLAVLVAGFLAYSAFSLNK